MEEDNQNIIVASINEQSDSIECSYCKKKIDVNDKKYYCNILSIQGKGRCIETYCSSTCVKNDFIHINNHLVRKRKFYKEYVKHTKGIQNEGKTCFMNSILQCLSNCYDFALYFILKEYSTNHNNTYLLSDELNTIFTDMYTENKKDVLYITSLISKMKYFKDLNGYSDDKKQDANEFLINLMNSLCKELRGENSETQKNMLEEKEKKNDCYIGKEKESKIENGDEYIRKLFFGEYINISQCICQNNTRDEPFLCIFIAKKENLFFYNFDCDKLEFEKQYLSSFINSPTTLNIILNNEMITKKHKHFFLVHNLSMKVITLEDNFKSSYLSYGKANNEVIICYTFSHQDYLFIFFLLDKKPLFKYPICFKASNQNQLEEEIKIIFDLENSPYEIYLDNNFITKADSSNINTLFKTHIGYINFKKSVKVKKPSLLEVNNNTLTLNGCLDYYFSSKYFITGNSTCLTCKNCHSVITSKSYIKTLPVYLIISFTTVDSNQLYFPKTLNMYKYVKEEYFISSSEEDFNYELIAINDYIQNFFKKHYTAIVKVHHEWLNIDDKTPSITNLLKNEKSKNATILFYHRRISNSNKKINSNNIIINTKNI